MNQNKNYIIGGIFLFLAVALGAFGAHGLKEVLTEKTLQTYKTGIQYQFYHGFGILILSIISQQFKIDLKKSINLFSIGIILFSFNCYLYAITQIKTIAMIIPIGGVFFILGWLFFIKSMIKIEEKNA